MNWLRFRDNSQAVSRTEAVPRPLLRLAKRTAAQPRQHQRQEAVARGETTLAEILRAARAED
jgi:hypothetical protein